MTTSPPAAAAADRRTREQTRWRAVFGGIFLVAFGTLLFEISLIRILSFTIWHHFGYVVISTALLGFGASGTVLAIRPATGTKGSRANLASCALASSVAMLAALAFVGTVPLRPMRILDDPVQTLLLVAYQIAAAIPFFFAGLSVSLALRAGAARVDRLYFWDLLGGGLGCVCAVALMNTLTPPGAAVIAAAVLALGAAVLAGTRAIRAFGVTVALACVIAAPFASHLPFTPAPNKEYALMVNLLGAEPAGFEWTALFRTDLVANKPVANAPNWGLSRTAPSGLEQPSYHLTHDATAGAGIYDLRDDSELDYVPYHVLQLPYRVVGPDARVLVIGVGGGRDIVVAKQMGAGHVTGVDLDPVALRWIRDDLDLTNGFFRRPDIELVAAEGRHFVHTSSAHFDVIQLTGVDTLSAVNSGAYVLSENYLYTVEAVHAYLDRLTTDGVLSFTMANEQSATPKSVGRLVSVARQALEERGALHPERHIAVIDSGMLYASVLIRVEEFSRQQTSRLAAIATDLSLPVLLLPDHAGHPVFEGLASPDPEARRRLLEDLHHRVDATTDDNPFFLSFFRWRDLLTPARLTASHASALSQIVLAVLLISLTVLGALFILAPLLAFGRRSGGRGDRGKAIGVMAFFVSIGMGFMLFEISLIQRFVLFLGYPTYSLSVTLCSLLVFLGCGSALSRHVARRHRQILPIAVVLIALLAIFYAEGLPAVQDRFLASSTPLRALVTALVLAPLGLVMGIFFPIGIRLASAINEDWVPWAWGINGCASVTAGVLAIILAMTFGFRVVWAISVGCYAIGVAALLLTTRSVEPLAEGAAD